MSKESPHRAGHEPDKTNPSTASVEAALIAAEISAAGLEAHPLDPNQIALHKATMANLRHVLAPQPPIH